MIENVHVYDKKEIVWGRHLSKNANIHRISPDVSVHWQYCKYLQHFRCVSVPVQQYLKHN